MLFLSWDSMGWRKASIKGLHLCFAFPSLCGCKHLPAEVPFTQPQPREGLERTRTGMTVLCGSCNEWRSHTAPESPSHLAAALVCKAVGASMAAPLPMLTAQQCGYVSSSCCSAPQSAAARALWKCPCAFRVSEAALTCWWCFNALSWPWCALGSRRRACITRRQWAAEIPPVSTAALDTHGSWHTTWIQPKCCYWKKGFLCFPPVGQSLLLVSLALLQYLCCPEPRAGLVYNCLFLSYVPCHLCTLLYFFVVAHTKHLTCCYMNGSDQIDCCFIIKWQIWCAWDGHLRES